MHRFWSTVIGPVLEAAEARSIVEIGAAEGRNTENLLTYVAGHGGLLHVVDPSPSFDAHALADAAGATMELHTELSLAALPAIGAVDAILIDGDHNWYTVFNELTLIEHSAAGAESFPVVLLHDLTWPYGRRDLYYSPKRVPAEYRREYAYAGIGTEEPGLLGTGGFNAFLANASREGGDRNGVLTAIEDFLEATPLPLSLTRVEGFHGLGVLVPEGHPAREALARVLNGLDAPEALRERCESLEAARVRLLVFEQELDEARRETKRLRAMARRVEKADGQLKRASTRLDRAMSSPLLRARHAIARATSIALRGRVLPKDPLAEAHSRLQAARDLLSEDTGSTSAGPPTSDPR